MASGRGAHLLAERGHRHKGRLRPAEPADAARRLAPERLSGGELGVEGGGLALNGRELLRPLVARRLELAARALHLCALGGLAQDNAASRPATRLPDPKLLRTAK